MPQERDVRARDRNHAVKAGMEVRHKADKPQHGWERTPKHFWHLWLLRGLRTFLAFIQLCYGSHRGRECGGVHNHQLLEKKMQFCPTKSSLEEPSELKQIRMHTEIPC